jgi:hypothetical protein
MDLIKLRTELISDPLTRGYASMTDAQAAESLNTANRASTRTLVDTWEILEATVPAEYTPLSSALKTQYQLYVSAGRIDVSRANTRAAFALMFGAGTVTRTNLLALSAGPLVSRAVELELGVVAPGDVQCARANA